MLSCPPNFPAFRAKNLILRSKLSKAIKDDTTIIRNQIDEVTKGVSQIQVNQIGSLSWKAI